MHKESEVFGQKKTMKRTFKVSAGLSKVVVVMGAVCGGISVVTRGSDFSVAILNISEELSEAGRCR